MNAALGGNNVNGLPCSILYLRKQQKKRTVNGIVSRSNSQTIRANKHLIKAWKTRRFFSLSIVHVVFSKVFILLLEIKTITLIVVFILHTHWVVFASCSTQVVTTVILHYTSLKVNGSSKWLCGLWQLMNVLSVYLQHILFLYVRWTRFRALHLFSTFWSNDRCDGVLEYRNVE